MLKIVIIPAFVIACLAIYAAVEEAMQWKYGHRQTPETVEDIIRWDKWREDVQQTWLDCHQRAEDFYAHPWNRFRLWLANIIAP